MTTIEERVNEEFAPYEDGIEVIKSQIDALSIPLEYRQNELDMIEYWRKLMLQSLNEYDDLRRDFERVSKEFWSVPHTHIQVGDKLVLDPPYSEEFLEAERRWKTAQYMVEEFDLAKEMSKVLGQRERRVRRNTAKSFWFDKETAEKNLR